MDQDPHILYPMTNLLLIGPSGIGKSSAIYMAKELLPTLGADGPAFIQGQATQEGLHKALSMRPHAIIFASELANFFGRQRYMEGMVPYITELFDYKESMSRLLMSGLTVIQKPSATLMGGSTVQWLQEQLPDSAAAGGFLPRFLIVKEDHKFQRVPYPKETLGPQRWRELMAYRQKIYHEFLEIVAGFEGEMTFEDYDAKDEYGLWYQTYLPAGGHLEPFAARAREFVLRMAILSSRSRQARAIGAVDIRSAIKLYNYASRKLSEVVVPFSPQGKLQAKILEVVGDGSSTIMMIRRAMRNYTAASETDKLVDSLVLMGELKRAGDELRRISR